MVSDGPCEAMGAWLGRQDDYLIDGTTHMKWLVLTDVADFVATRLTSTRCDAARRRDHLIPRLGTSRIQRLAGGGL